jgi:hypothetical protein
MLVFNNVYYLSNLESGKMNQKNKMTQLTLTKTALRVLNEQEMHQVGGGDSLIPVEPISMVWVTNNTTMTKVPSLDTATTLESSHCDTATTSESSGCDVVSPFASNP